MAQAHEAVEASLSKIDTYHTQFQKDCWVRGIRTESVLTLDRLVAEEENA